MYWLREEEEELTWDEVNLFQNDISKGMASTALLAETELHSELEAVLRLDCPEGIGEKRWNQVKERTRRLRERLDSLET